MLIRCFQWKRLIILGMGFLLLHCLPLIAGDVSLTWDPSTSDGVIGYKIYYGAVSGSYDSFQTVTNQTSCTITGLSAGTYYFAVTAFDTTGNESGYSNEVSTAVDGTVAPADGNTQTVPSVPSDTTPPTIGSIASRDVTTTGAVISWTTNEASDSGVDYGTAATSLTTVGNGTMTTSHTLALSGLNPGTEYIYRVKSSDASGNPAVSAYLKFTTVEPPDTTPPEISSVVVSGQTGTEAVITWTTNEVADSQIEYGASASYGSSSDFDSSAVFSHRQVLNELVPGTTYHFRVLSSDEAGNLASSSDYTFTTMEVALTQTMPMFHSELTVSDDLYIGMAFMNEGDTAATVAFTAFDENGNMVEGSGLKNPAVLPLEPYQQRSLVDVEVFGDNLSKYCSNGWIRMESTTEKVRGFALTFDGLLRLMDGVHFASEPLNKFVFTHIETNGKTGISLINRNPDAIEVTIDLVAGDGSVRQSLSKVVGGNAALTDDLYAELFKGITPNSSDYVRVSADSGVEPFQVIQQGTADISFLRGQDLNSAASRIYLPRYVYDKGYRTDISVVNMDGEIGNVTVRLLGNNGAQIGATRSLAIAANGKLFIDGPEFFLDQTLTEEQSLDTQTHGKSGKLTTRSSNKSSSSIDGYVEIVSDGMRLVGSTSYRGRNSQSFITAFPLVTQLQKRIAFGHVVSDDLYYTELALANPGLGNASVILDLFNSQGEFVDTATLSVAAGRQSHFSLKDVFKTLQRNSQTGGYVILNSDVPVAAFSSFGTYDQAVFSAIPVQ
jgi:hypothetical protein